MGSRADHKAQEPRQTRGQRTSRLSFQWPVHPGTHGVLRRVHEPVALHARRLARDSLANILRGDTVRIPAAQVHRRARARALTEEK